MLREGSDSFVRFDYIPENLHPYKLPCYIDIGPKDREDNLYISKTYSEYFDLWAECIGIEKLPKVMYYQGKLMSVDDSIIVWREYIRWHHEGMEQEEGYTGILEEAYSMHYWNPPNPLLDDLARIFEKEACICSFLPTIKENLSKKVNDQAVCVVQNMIANMTRTPERVAEHSINAMGNILQLMKEGEKEFRSKTGRDMTYSEMRDMWG